MNGKNMKIVAVGDIFLGDYTICIGYGIRSMIEKKGHEFIIKDIAGYLKHSDIVFGNLETVLSDIDLDSKNIISLACRGKPEFVKVLTDSGFNYINIANNHILQHGERAFHETIRILEENDINVVGVNKKGKYICNPVVKKIKDLNVAFLGYCFCPEFYYKNDVLYAAGSRNDILNEIKAVKSNADILIISCHWGVELIDKPSINTRILARMIVDSGADIIIGHHPHVVQGIEEYKGSIILYSLGNFIFDITFSRELRTSVLVEITIDEHKNISYAMIPLKITSQYKPVLMNDKDSEKFKKYLYNISNHLNDDPNYEDLEENHYEYYSKAFRIKRKMQMQKVFYLIKNLTKLDVIVYGYLARKMFNKFINYFKFRFANFNKT